MDVFFEVIGVPRIHLFVFHVPASSLGISRWKPPTNYIIYPLVNLYSSRTGTSPSVRQTNYTSPIVHSYVRTAGDDSLV